jgi:DNA-binding LacI/PurR family transcriptional regulator
LKVLADIKDVAKRAGVSISTVSNAINNTKYVSEELMEKIKLSVTELNYEVDPIARSLKSKKTMSIGVVITNINRIFFSQVIKGIQDCAAANNYNIILCNTDDSFEFERTSIQLFEKNLVDGIILDSVAGIEQHQYFSYIGNLGKRKRIPVISLERDLKNYGINSVLVNNELGGRIAAMHLTDFGCKKSVLIAGPLNSSIVIDRINGFKNELDLRKCHLNDDRVVEGDFSPLSGYQVIKKLLLYGCEMDSIFAVNDQMAIGAMKAIWEHGLRIPEDIKLVGFDNTFVASLIEPSLTTVNVPKYQLGMEAAKLLVKLMEDNTNAVEEIELPINLIIRQSTDLKGDKNLDLYGW